MGYQAIARKWRPTHFDELVGQNHVVQTLKNAIALNRVAHAYLFSGARGVGKTSVARIFAKTLRCPNTKQSIPCNQCSECTAISESRSVDVVEIDGASNNGVEAIREIRENVAYGASSGKHKIYIIDEVHMLSISAFNALLKTLEEPPPHILFIFATTEVQKIPLTILSRCQRFEFRRLSIQEIAERLTEILQTESVKLSEPGIQTIANQSDGSLRDAQSLLDQVLSYFGESSEPLSEAQVAQSLGITHSSLVREFLSAIIEKKTESVIGTIGEVYFSGIDLKHFAERCLTEVRLIYLVALAKQEKTELSAKDLDISQDHLKLIESLSEKSSVVKIERMAQILNRCIFQLSSSSLPRFLFEMAAVKMTQLDSIAEIEAVLTGKQTLAARPAPSQKTPPAVPTAKVTSATSRPPQPRHNAASPESTWKSLIETIMKKRPLLGALLSHANFKLSNENDNKQVQLVFPEESFYEKQAKEPKYQKEIESLLKEFFGPNTALNLSSDADGTHESLEKVRETEVKAIKKEALEHPSVQMAQERLGAEVVDVNIKTQL